MVRGQRVAGGCASVFSECVSFCEKKKKKKREREEKKKIHHICYYDVL